MKTPPQDGLPKEAFATTIAERQPGKYSYDQESPHIPRKQMARKIKACAHVGSFVNISSGSFLSAKKGERGQAPLVGKVWI